MYLLVLLVVINEYFHKQVFTFSVHAMQLSFYTIPALGHICSYENPVKIACKNKQVITGA